MPKKASTFKFRKTDRIGAAGAEEDGEFLQACFVDTGDRDLLEDLSDNRVIILGRTGTGKSALLQTLAHKRPDRVIELRPENLALTYVAHSTILNHFTSIGVNFDPFFSLLWRHVLTVEILKREYDQRADRESQNLPDWLRSLFVRESKTERHETATVDYLEKWGKQFWQETEFRVKEITQIMETELCKQAKASIGGGPAQLSGGLQAIDKLTDEQRSELVSRGQDIVSKAQVQDLHQVIEALGSVLEDRQKQYYVFVDSLDENWVEEKLRYKLIMALILTAREFIKVKNAKVIVALRRDLVDRVFRMTRDSGFQEEKYQSLYLPLAWTRKDILEVLDKRVRRLVSRRYTKATVTHKDLLPPKFNKKQIGDYIFSLAKKPRDVIAFFNTCIQAGAGQAKLGLKQLAIAEGEYSRSRLRALADEWSADYPSLLEFARLFNRRPSSFKLGLVSDGDIGDLCLNILSENPGRGELCDGAKAVVDCLCAPADFRLTLFQVFYKVGLVGLKLSPHEGASWADELGQAVSRSQVTVETSVVVNPAYVRALGVIDRAHHSE